MSYSVASSALSLPSSDLDVVLSEHRAYVYPKYAVAFVFSAVFAATLYNALTSLHNFLHLRRECQARPSDSGESKVSGGAANTEESQRTASNRRVALQRAPEVLLNAARIISFRKTRPPLFQFVVIAAYFISMLLFDFVNSRNIHGLLDATYWAKKAGTLAVSQLVFLVALSGKNNIISTLTGITYERLNVLHRAGARITLLLIWIHVCGRIDLGVSGKDSLKSGWMRAGLLSTVTLTLAAILGTRQLRNANYGLFHVGHVTLVFIFLVSGYFHVRVATEFLPYIWLASLLWAVDRTLRFARTLRIRLLSVRIKEDSRENATLELLTADTLRVHLRLSSSGKFPLRWRAGQSAYLCIPTASRLGISFEAHPFTIASIDEPKHDSGSTETSLQNILCFIIRIRGGFTRRLQRLAVSEGGVTHVSAFVDGPYGDPPDVSAFHTVVLIAGGSGVSFTLPLLLELCRRSRDNQRPSLCKRVLFVWIVREEGHANWILQELVAVNESKGDIKIELYLFITRSSRSHIELSGDSNESSFSHSRYLTTISSSGTSEPGSATFETPRNDIGNQKPLILQENTALSIVYSKPDIESILKGVTSLSVEPVAVCASGPESLTDVIRKALGKCDNTVSMNVLRGGPSIFLHVEQFSM